MPPTDAQPQKTQTVQISNEEDAPTLYCNNVQMRISAWDICLFMGEIVEANAEALVVKNKTTVYMSPQHAKVFAQMLTNNIAEYERVIGKIPNPSSGEQSEVEVAQSE